MEVVVRSEDIEQGLVEDSGKPCSELATLDQVADPVVYKLVKVDYDGKLVPATDDELMEVENLLELEKNETVDVMDTGTPPGLDKDASKTSHYRGALLIKNEEVDEDSVKSRKKSLYTTVLHSTPDMSEKIKDGTDLDSRPNFSLLEGEIDLDKLTIRELQETFRATFGRKTSVKDKIWLKRRIAMGLTKSCDVSMTRFVISNGKLLNEVDDFCKTMVCEDSIAGEIDGSGRDELSANSGSLSNPRKVVVDDTAFKSRLADSGYRSDDSLDHRAAKRVRKPTKRYIEELSDEETNNDPSGKSISPSKRNEHDKFSSSSVIRTAWGANTGAFVTRRDSIGGSGVQVPYVSRVRRCRPRQSIMTLLKFSTSDAALTSKTNESSHALNNPQPDTSSKAEIVDAKSAPSEDMMGCEDLVEKQSVAVSDGSRDREPKGEEDSGGCTSRDTAAGTSSNDNVANIPTTKSGMRRKHHRAWTLTEVMKLVDGVSRFGPGRWSEIKRLSFSSYSYRTAVDLKDKWRNLLKASSCNTPAEKGMNPRSKAPMPIPTPILVKVRELAELNGQTFKVSREYGRSSVN